VLEAGENDAGYVQPNQDQSQIGQRLVNLFQPVRIVEASLVIRMPVPAVAASTPRRAITIALLSGLCPI